MENSKPSLIYVYDALCGWCFGFSPVIKEIYFKYNQTFDFEVISGGMIMGEREGPISEVAEYIKRAYKIVEKTTSVKFGDLFIKNVLEEGSRYFSSEKPAIALSVFKTYHPNKAILFAHQLQNLLYFEGKDLNIDETYKEVAVHFDINPDEFLLKLKKENFKQNAYYDFALSKQLQVKGYPAVFIKTDDLHFYMIANGYTDENTLGLRIENVLKEIAITQ